MTPLTSALDEGPEFEAIRIEVDADSAGLEQALRETIDFVSAQLPSAVAGAEGVIAGVFSLCDQIADAGSRVVVEADATPVDVQLIVRVVRGDDVAPPFGLVNEAGDLEVWLRVRAETDERAPATD